MPKDRTAYYDSRDGSVLTLFLLPTLLADVEARAFSADNTELRLPSAAMAAAVFLTAVRGLPLGECEVLIGDKVEIVNISGNGGKCEIILPKCKQLFSKTELFRRNIDLDCYIYSDNIGEILLLPSGDDECVPAEVLRSLLLPESGPLRMACAVFADSPERISARYLTAQSSYGVTLRCALVAATYARRVFPSAERLGILVSDSRLRDADRVELDVRSFGSGLAVSMVNAPAPLTFYTP